MTRTARDIGKLIESWRGPRESPDGQPLTVIGRLRGVYCRLGNSMERQGQDMPLAKPELVLLNYLRAAGAPYRRSPGELLKLNHLSSGGMTKQIDRLEERGLVRRVPNPDDRRSVLVELTDEGRAVGESGFAWMVDLEDRLLADFTEDERVAFAAMLRRLGDAVEREFPD